MQICDISEIKYSCHKIEKGMDESLSLFSIINAECEMNNR